MAKRAANGAGASGVVEVRVAVPGGHHGGRRGASVFLGGGARGKKSERRERETSLSPASDGGHELPNGRRIVHRVADGAPDSARSAGELEHRSASPANEVGQRRRRPGPGPGRRGGGILRRSRNGRAEHAANAGGAGGVGKHGAAPRARHPRRRRAARHQGHALLGGVCVWLLSERASDEGLLSAFCHLRPLPSHSRRELHSADFEVRQIAMFPSCRGTYGEEAGLSPVEMKAPPMSLSYSRNLGLIT